ncbi:MAG TPA: HU family DNA-binding protein [Cellulomonadaceae bacterium]|nr:HU family DNA-binding protein [Cellulomonadaceae bacterium]
MNKTEMLAELERRLGSHRAAVSALDAVLGAVQEAVAAGDKVTLTGFGTFERVTRPGRTGRNPRTGAPIEIAASSLPRFRAGAALRAAVAGVTSTRQETSVAPAVAAPSVATASSPSGTDASGKKTSGAKAAAKKTSGKATSASKASGKKTSGKATSATKASRSGR